MKIGVYRRSYSVEKIPFYIGPCGVYLGSSACESPGERNSENTLHRPNPQRYPLHVYLGAQKRFNIIEKNGPLLAL